MNRIQFDIPFDGGIALDRACVKGASFDARLIFGPGYPVYVYRLQFSW